MSSPRSKAKPTHWRPRPPRSPRPKPRSPPSARRSNSSGVTAYRPPAVRPPRCEASWSRCVAPSSAVRPSNNELSPAWPVCARSSRPCRTKPIGCATTSLRPNNPSCRSSRRSTTPSDVAPMAKRRWPRPKKLIARPRATCTRRVHAPKPWLWRSTRLGRAPAPNGWPMSTVCSAPCSTSSRSMPAGRPLSKPPPARPSRPSSSKDGTPLGEP